MVHLLHNSPYHVCKDQPQSSNESHSMDIGSSIPQDTVSESLHSGQETAEGVPACLA